MKEELNFKLSGNDWKKLQDEAFEKVNKRQRLMVLDQERLQETYMKRNMEYKIFFLKQLIWQ